MLVASTNVGWEGAAAMVCSARGVAVAQCVPKGNYVDSNAVGLASKVFLHPFGEGRSVREVS